MNVTTPQFQGAATPTQVRAVPRFAGTVPAAPLRALTADTVHFGKKDKDPIQQTIFAHWGQNISAGDVLQMMSRRFDDHAKEYQLKDDRGWFKRSFNIGEIPTILAASPKDLLKPFERTKYQAEGQKAFKQLVDSGMLDAYDNGEKTSYASSAEAVAISEKGLKYLEENPNDFDLAKDLENETRFIDQSAESDRLVAAADLMNVKDEALTTTYFKIGDISFNGLKLLETASHAPISLSEIPTAHRPGAKAGLDTLVETGLMSKTSSGSYTVTEEANDLLAVPETGENRNLHDTLYRAALTEAVDQTYLEINGKKVDGKLAMGLIALLGEQGLKDANGILPDSLLEKFNQAYRTLEEIGLAKLDIPQDYDYYSGRYTPKPEAATVALTDDGQALLDDETRADARQLFAELKTAREDEIQTKAEDQEVNKVALDYHGLSITPKLLLQLVDEVSAKDSKVAPKSIAITMLFEDENQRDVKVQLDYLLEHGFLEEDPHTATLQLTPKAERFKTAEPAGLVAQLGDISAELKFQQQKDILASKYLSVGSMDLSGQTLLEIVAEKQRSGSPLNPSEFLSDILVAGGQRRNALENAIKKLTANGILTKQGNNVVVSDEGMKFLTPGLDTDHLKTLPQMVQEEKSKISAAKAFLKGESDYQIYRYGYSYESHGKWTTESARNIEILQLLYKSRAEFDGRQTVAGESAYANTLDTEYQMESGDRSRILMSFIKAGLLEYVGNDVPPLGELKLTPLALDLAQGAY